MLLFGLEKKCITEKGQFLRIFRILWWCDVVKAWVRNTHNLHGVTKSVNAVL